MRSLPARLRSELGWKLLVARLLVSVLAVAATVVVVPGLSIDGDFWQWALVLGAVFGVLNGVVKPVLQVLTIRYLFLSWGLVLLLVNIATLWLLELLVPPLDIDGGLSLVLGALVLGLLVPLLETLIGTGQPILERSTPSERFGPSERLTPSERFTSSPPDTAPERVARTEGTIPPGRPGAG